MTIFNYPFVPNFSSRNATRTLMEKIRLYNTETIHKRGPWRTVDDVKYATLEWVDWFNRRRQLEPIGNILPAELEMAYCRQLESV